jgi:hypothetical protein
MAGKRNLWVVTEKRKVSCMTVKMTIWTIIFLVLSFSPLIAHDKYVRLRDVTVKNGVQIFADNNALTTRTVAVAFPVLVNMKASVTLPATKVLPALCRNVLVLELTKKDIKSSYQYRYKFGAVEGDKLTGPLNWLGLPMKNDDEEVDKLKTSLQEPFPKFVEPDKAPFLAAIKNRLSPYELKTGNGITNEMLDGYSNPINETRVLTIRCVKIGRTVLILAQNGCKKPMELTLEFNVLKNMTASKKVPYVTTVPRLTEQYLLFLRGDDDECKYNYRFIYNGLNEVEPVELERPESSSKR